MEKDYKMPVSVDSGEDSRPTLMWMLAGIAIGLGAGLTMYFVSNQNVDREPALLSESSDTVIADVESISQADENRQENENTVKADPTMLDTDNVIEKTSQTMIHDAQKDEHIAEFEFYGILPELDVMVPKVHYIPEPDSRGTHKAPAAEPMALSHDKTIPPVITKAEVKTPAFVNSTDEKLVGATATAEKVSSKASSASTYRRFQTASYVSATTAQNRLREFKQMGMQGYIEKASVNGRTMHRVIIGPTNDPKVLSKWNSILTGMGIQPIRLR